LSLVKTRSLKDLQGRIEHLRGQLLKAFDEAGPSFDVGRVKVFTGSTGEKLEKFRSADRELADLITLVETRVDLSSTRLPGKGRSGFDLPERKSPGHQAVEAFKSPTGKGNRNKVMMTEIAPADLGLGTKSVIALGGTGGLGPVDVPSVTGLMADLAEQPPTLAEWLPTIPVDKWVARWLQETATDNAAAETAEGDAMPEASLTVQEVLSQLKNVGVVLPVSDELFDDDEAAVRYVDRRLHLFAQERIDAQALDGDGTGTNLLGFHELAGKNESTYVAAGATAQTKLAAILAGAGKVATVGKAVADTVVIEAGEWWELLAARDGQGEFLFDPTSPPTSLWGLKPIVTTAQEAGRYLVGAVRSYSVLFARSVTQLELSREHSTFFTGNKLMLRLVVPAWLAVEREAAFTEVMGA
jgi:hypothetical protein